MEKVSAYVVHKQTYKELKAELGLKSQYLCSARNRAVESVQAVRILQKKGRKISKPQSRRIPLRLDARTLSFDKERKVVSVATQRGRIKFPIHWHKQALKYSTWECKAGELGFDRRERLVIRLIFEKQVEKTTRTGKAIGVDRGIRHALVCSDNRFLDEGEWRENERKLFALISRLQSQGTASAKRHLKKTSGRLRRFKKNCDRIIARDFLVK